jgi:hypothetical protein
MAESHHIGLTDYTIPTIGILIIATGIRTCKTCANFEVYIVQWEESLYKVHKTSSFGCI